MGEERLFEDLLRRTHLDLSGLVGRLLKLFAAPKVERVFEVTIAAGQTSVTAPHGLNRQLQYAAASPKTAVAYAITWDATNVTVSIAAAVGADVTFSVAGY